MATRKPNPKTALMKWDEELAKHAEAAAVMEANAGGGQFFSIKGGVLSWQDSPVANNQMAVIILDSVLENVYYEGPYDPDVLQSPLCFAFGRDDKTMAPHAMVIEAGNQQHNQCTGCENNEFGTAIVGKGKACRNTRRLCMIPAGTLDANGRFQLFQEEEHFISAAAGYMKLPVTSVKGYASFVKQVAGALGRPPFGIVTKVKVVPDAKNQFKITFEPLVNVPDEVMGIVMKRHEEVKATIEFPYQPMEEETKPTVKGRSKAGKQSAAGRRKY